MTTVDGKLNAKQRRKLLRQQQRQLENSDSAKRNDFVKQEQEQIQLKSVKQEQDPKQEPVVPVEPKTASQDEHQNTKERQRPAQLINQFPETESEIDNMNLNAQQRRLLKRRVNKVNDQTVTKKQRNESESIGENVKSPGNCKSIHLTLFVGQLPFKTTEEMIRKHFAEAGEIEVRMLTDKKTKKFKGMAFIEVKDSKALGAALSRHHTLLLGRRINVELTASGGGNKSEIRRNKIDLLRKKQSAVQVKKTKALIQKHIDGQEYKLQQKDVDDRMIDFLSWFDYETAKKALDEYNCCVSDRVNNRKAFFMGILKRFRQTDGVE